MQDGAALSPAARIREDVRRSTVQERLCQRQKVLRGLRNLSEIEEELKVQAILSPDEIVLLAGKIKQNSQTSLADLRSLKQSLCNQENISAFLRVVGALQAVVGHLTGRKALHQLEASYICCNLALGDEHACSNVSSAAGPYLIELLNSQNTVLQEACAWCLGNLAGGSSNSLKLLKSQGLVPHLTSCLKSPHNDVVEASIYAFCHMLQTSLGSHTDPLHAEEMKAIAHESCKLMQSCHAVHWLLFLLSCLSWCDDILIDQSLPLFCLNFLYSKLPEINSQNADLNILRSVTSLLRSAANLCTEPTGQAALLFLNHQFFLTVIQALVSSAHTHLQAESRWFAANLLHHSSGNVISAACNVGLVQIVKFNQD